MRGNPGANSYLYADLGDPYFSFCNMRLLVSTMKLPRCVPAYGGGSKRKEGYEAQRNLQSTAGSSTTDMM
jgi:hypothetical protein